MTKDGKRLVAVVEALGEEAETGARGAGIAVGEEGDVGASVCCWGLGILVVRSHQGQMRRFGRGERSCGEDLLLARGGVCGEVDCLQGY